MDKMTYMVMQEIVSHFRSQSQSGTSNEQSSRTDHMPMCMNIMSEMGITQYQQMIMWHYIDAHPRLQRTFHQLPDDDRRGIIASVVQSQSPPTDWFSCSTHFLWTYFFRHRFDINLLIGLCLFIFLIHV